MNKKIYSALICIVLIFAFGINSYASSGLVKITRPEGSEESTFKKTYLICGNTDKEGVTVELSVYDDSLGYYVPYFNTEGESSWVIGSSGMFMKEVELKSGANLIKIFAYRNSDPQDQQTETFTITLLKENLKDKIVNGVLKFSDVLNNVKNVFN